MRYAFVYIFLFISLVSSQEKPNILWISVEDMSPVLGCYGDKISKTPIIDAFAQKSDLFTNAFATSPVCAPSRSCLINGLPASSQGTHHMRSFQKIPDYMTGFPTLLRRAGYYTSNNVKTDYNSSLWKTIIENSWDESSNKAHWRNRPQDKPFFSVFNIMTTHQSRTMVWPYEQFKTEVQNYLSKDNVNEASQRLVPPYYPDTEVVRKTQARFYDCVNLMDEQVGDLLNQLREDGLEKNTIVFFFSDHGSGMPRHKRALLDSGMKVPLIVHIPERYKTNHKVNVNSLVNFADFAPTVLKMAGVKVPDHMEGKDIYSSDVRNREYVFGHRDRVDEVRDMARSVRGKRFLYIRNFMPHLGYNQATGWPDLGEIRHEFYALNKDSVKLSPSLKHFISPNREVEELYDCIADPQNLKNLAKDESYRNKLQEMRQALKEEMLVKKDLGIFPEADMKSISVHKPLYEVIRKNDLEYEEILNQSFEVGIRSEKDFAQSLNSSNGSIRYWALIGLKGFKNLTKKTKSQINNLLNDSYSAVRIVAASILYNQDKSDFAKGVLEAELKSKNYLAKLHACRVIELFGNEAFETAMKEVEEEIKPFRSGPATVVKDGDADIAMFIGLSQDAYFKKLNSEWVSLFNGENLNGWHYKTSGEVKVENNAISLFSEKKNLWLQTKKTFKDFELKVEAKMPESGYNSGIGFRCTTEGKLHGFQCEVDQKKTGSIYAIGKGWINPLKKDGWEGFYKVAGNCYKPGDWNSYHIICRGNRIQVFVNGHKTSDITSDAFKEGSIAIQHHGKGDIHYFRNIYVKELR